MAQAEDTELRDLVIEALEKNGSLAKIRALLRANIFLAFEDECDSIKQNINLENILKLPEGILALSLVHEFLEFCNLKNTLFVYMSESRQGRDYTYKGRKILAEELHLTNGSHDVKEPVLLTFVKNIVRVYQKKYYDQGDGAHDKRDPPYIHKDDENCTYIVHEDSTTSTSSNSDNSSDEKNKLHFKLPLDHSDTDTSSDSTREKSSEYIPSQHVLSQVNPEPERELSHLPKSSAFQKETNLTSQTNINSQTPFLQDLKMNNSSESTSYVDIKSYITTNQQNLSVPSIRVDNKTESANNTNLDSHPHPDDPLLKADSVSSATLNSISSISQKNDNIDDKLQRNKMRYLNDHTKSDTEATEYSLDFTSSPPSKHNFQDGHLRSPEQIEKPLLDKTSQLESPRQNSQSSQSSVSISDVADLIEYSDKNLLELSSSKENLSGNSNKSNDESGNQNKPPSEDSGDYSDSPIPSLSNLSLDVHSD